MPLTAKVILRNFVDVTPCAFECQDATGNREIKFLGAGGGQLGSQQEFVFEFVEIQTMLS